MVGCSFSEAAPPGVEKSDSFEN